jgi:hypothetical protein
MRKKSVARWVNHKLSPKVRQNSGLEASSLIYIVIHTIEEAFTMQTINPMEIPVLNHIVYIPRLSNFH